MSNDLLTLLADFPALDEQGGTLFVKGDDRGIANLFDVPEADALMDLVTAVPRLREAMLKSRTTVERLSRENDGLTAQVGEARREHDTARGDLDAVRRVLAEGLGADAKESDLDALALAARACETIDLSRAQRDALARGETTPSLDAIRAHVTNNDGAPQLHTTNGGVWVVVWRSAVGWRAEAVCVRTFRWDDRLVVEPLHAIEGFVCDHAGLVERYGHDARWWRVAPDGSLAVAKASS